MTTAMEFHDSYLRELICNADGTGHALFCAVIFRSAGQVFEDSQESGYQNLRLDFMGMGIEGEILELAFAPYASDGDSG